MSSNGDFAQPLAGQAQQQVVNVNSQLVALKDIQKDGTTIDVSVRSKLNFITGDNTTLTVADNADSDRVDVTIAASTSPGAELDYAQITSSVTGISTTSEATATTIVTGNSVSYDGSTRVKVEFFAPEVGGSNVGTGALTFVLFRDSSAVGQIATFTAYTGTSTVFLGGSVKGEWFDTPASGSHTYTVKAFINNGTMYVNAGAGGSGTLVPAFIRVTTA